MGDVIRVAIVVPADGTPPGVIAQLAWQAGQDADVVVLPELPTEHEGRVTLLSEAAERGALLREKLIRNLVGSDVVVVTSIVEFGVTGPGLVAIAVTQDGVEARSFSPAPTERHPWTQTHTAWPALVERPWGTLAIAAGQIPDDLSADVVAVPAAQPLSAPEHAVVVTREHLPAVIEIAAPAPDPEPGAPDSDESSA